MDYKYDYGYLKHFKESHKLSKKDLLEALGSSDYTGINRWLDGKTPMHVTAMLRFCNYYQIPVSGFFLDGDGESEMRVLPPTEDSQTEPTDRYGMGGGAGKSIIETHVEERTYGSTAQAKAVREGMERERLAREAALVAQRTEQSAGASAGAAIESPAMDEGYGPDGKPSGTVASEAATESEAMLRLRLEHANELRMIEREHHSREDQIRRDCQASFDAERNRLMDIIERQNAELAKCYAKGQGEGEG